MKRVYFGRLTEVLQSWPNIYTLMPETDYQIIVSHSASDIASEAWRRTGNQMRSAIKDFEAKNPYVRRKSEVTA